VILAEVQVSDRMTGRLSETIRYETLTGKDILKVKADFLAPWSRACSLLIAIAVYG
jgi:hypothetical protein